MKTKTPRATLRILRRPDIRPGAARYEVDCRYSTTGLTHLPAPGIDLSDGVLTLAAAYEHEARCGRCDLSDVLDRGVQRLRRVVDEEWPRVEAALLERVMRGRRN